MSGGVDSSVAAALMLESGAEPVGVTALLGPDTDDSAPYVRDARAVCEILGIDHHVLDLRAAFDRDVVTPFVQGYVAGNTPNPCVTCNDKIKFGVLLDWALAQGFDALATGHYARVVADSPSGGSTLRLGRAIDESKDQSYFLYRLIARDLSTVRFPVGTLRKDDVRAMATRLGLPVAMRAESQDLCFTTLPPADFALRRAGISRRPGDIVDSAGTTVGRHDGLAAFTVGQRKGIGIGGVEQPYYVLALDAERNEVIVGPREALAVHRVEATDPLWAEGESVEGPIDALIRYRMRPAQAHAALEDGRLTVSFQSALHGVAPGQAVVCYRGDVVVGGGSISCAD
jgi:tRNA-specific 2-thiouridylase